MPPSDALRPGMPESPEPPHGGAPAGEPSPTPRDRFRTVVTVLIAIVSALGAIAAWRASVASLEATNLNEQGTLEQVQREQELADVEGTVNQDLRLFARYQEHLSAWRFLEADADRIRDNNAELAEVLVGQAQAELALARALQPLFQAATPGFGDEEGIAVYDREFVIENQRETSDVLPRLRPSETFRLAEEAQDKAVQLTAVVTLFIAALFFLTLAELTRRNIRGLFAGSGTGLAAVSLVLLIVVEVASL